MDEYTSILAKSGLPIAADVDESFTQLLVATSDKMVRVWSIIDLKIVFER